jgi:hypothetical protein
VVTHHYHCIADVPRANGRMSRSPERSHFQVPAAAFYVYWTRFDHLAMYHNLASLCVRQGASSGAPGQAYLGLSIYASTLQSFGYNALLEMIWTFVACRNRSLRFLILQQIRCIGCKRGAGADRDLRTMKLSRYKKLDPSKGWKCKHNAPYHRGERRNRIAITELY